MTKVKSHMSMSVDGFVAGPNSSQQNPLGTNGLKLHDWAFATPERGRQIEEDLKATAGAAIIGYNMYHEAIPHWGGTGPLGPDVPTFVLTTPDKIPQDAPPVFTFVTNGIESALDQAKKAAGDKDVWIGGGANTIQQYIKAGLLDELQLHVVPILLGSGTSMFDELGQFMELNKIESKDEPGVTHFTFRLR